MNTTKMPFVVTPPGCVLDEMSGTDQEDYEAHFFECSACEQLAQPPPCRPQYFPAQAYEPVGRGQLRKPALLTNTGLLLATLGCGLAPKSFAIASDGRIGCGW